MTKQLLRKLNSKKYRDKREREITVRAASIEELVANVRKLHNAKHARAAKADLLRALNRKIPDWDESDMQAVVSLLGDLLRDGKGRKDGSVTKNRKPKDSDQLIEIAVDVAIAKGRDPKLDVEALSAERLQKAGLHDAATNNQNTVLNWVTKKSRTVLMKRAASAGLLPRNKDAG